jgi:hypothetical protein
MVTGIVAGVNAEASLLAVGNIHGQGEILLRPADRARSDARA